ncbi:FAD:protein FMN transferase [Aquimarina pacifica]|uniref:FAD:protein FMN transferase n=1 Tax=Aquimarina pacifica TaxID=1296415 RepID=UPI00055771D5
MKYYHTLLLLFILGNCFSQELHKRTLVLMGSRFDITVVAEDATIADGYIQSAIKEIKRIEKLISSWDSDSQTSLINANAGVKPVHVEKELFDLIDRALQISRLTDGAFDISYASMDKIWTFDRAMDSKPSREEIKASVSKVGYKNILLDKNNNTVFLREKGMKIGFGGIGKGYAADKAKKKLMDIGVQAGIINASGDMNTWGKQPNGNAWKVAITNPLKKENAFALLPVSDKAVVTSGNYEKYVVFDGKRYSHIIDPRTGYPSHGIISVTVFAVKAEIADALATSVFVMGVEAGLDRINQLTGIECIIIDDEGGIHTSDHIDIDTN